MNKTPCPDLDSGLGEVMVLIENEAGVTVCQCMPPCHKHIPSSLLQEEKHASGAQLPCLPTEANLAAQKPAGLM